MADPKFAAMTKQLMALHDDKKYAAFLRQQSLAGDHSFLLAAIKRSNLHPSVRTVLEELITRKLRRPKHRPKSDDTDLKNVLRALRVLDLEAQVPSSSATHLARSPSSRMAILREPLRAR